MLRILKNTIISIIICAILSILLGIVISESETTISMIVYALFMLIVMNFIPFLVYTAFYSLLVDHFFKFKTSLFKILLVSCLSSLIVSVFGFVEWLNSDYPLLYYFNNYLYFILFSIVSSIVSYSNTTKFTDST